MYSQLYVRKKVSFERGTTHDSGLNLLVLDAGSTHVVLSFCSLCYNGYNNVRNQGVV